MKIGIIGAGGKAGSALYREAKRRGHSVTAIVRSRDRARAVLGSDVTMLEKSGFDLDPEDMGQFDAVINATGFPPAQAEQHVALARHLVSIAPGDSPRLVFILGAGSLFAGDPQHRYVDDIRQEPGSEAWIAIPENQLDELLYLETVTDANWVGVSPQALFYEGPAQPAVVGTDEIMVSADGASRTSTGTMAVGILNELENPAHHRTRFTVGDA